MACYLGMDLGSIKIKRFADGEIYVQVQVSRLHILAIRQCYSYPFMHEVLRHRCRLSCWLGQSGWNHAAAVRLTMLMPLLWAACSAV